MATLERPFGRYFEDFEVGDIYRHWPGKTITEADDHLFCMITMNHHPLHTNEWFAEHETVHGRNVVVGNLVYSLVLGMTVPDVSGAAIANLEVETLQHKMPTFHGDTIYAETRVLDRKESSSRPDRGIVTVETKGINQRGEEVCYFKRRVMVWKRDAAPPALPPLRRHEHLGLIGPDQGARSRARTFVHWASVTGMTDSRLPRRSEQEVVELVRVRLQLGRADRCGRGDGRSARRPPASGSADRTWGRSSGWPGRTGWGPDRRRG